MGQYQNFCATLAHEANILKFPFDFTLISVIRYPQALLSLARITKQEINTSKSQVLITLIYVAKMFESVITIVFLTNGIKTSFILRKPCFCLNDRGI